MKTMLGNVKVRCVMLHQLEAILGPCWGDVCTMLGHLRCFREEIDEIAKRKDSSQKGELTEEIARIRGSSQKSTDKKSPETTQRRDRPEKR